MTAPALHDEPPIVLVAASVTTINDRHGPHDRLSQSFRGKRVLVTGGASFIGSHLTDLLLEAGAEVTVADDLSSGRRENLSAVMADLRFLELDLRHAEHAARAAAGQEVVFHLAAAHGGRGYIESHPVECVNNMLLDHVVFAAAAAAGVQRIVYASSACVYPTRLQASASDRLLLKEADCNFIEPGGAQADGEYGWAKLMGELQLNAFVKQYGLSATACRLFTSYGERENESHAVIALIAKAVARLDPYPLWGTGTQTRNFTYVMDTVTGMALAGAAFDGFATINIGTDTHHTILALTDEIFRALGWTPNTIERQLDKPVGVQSRAADLTKSRARLDWAPQVDLAEGIRRTAEWYRTAYGETCRERLATYLTGRS